MTALHRAGVPENVAQFIHLSPELTALAIQNPVINFVSFTGSVVGGHAIARAAANATGFTGVALEVCGWYFLLFLIEAFSLCIS